MKIDILIDTLSFAGIGLETKGEHLALSGNVNAVTDELKAAVLKHKPELLKILGDHGMLQSSSAYPNADGLVKCVYCSHLTGYQCARSHHPDGLALLRHCDAFQARKGTE